MTRYEAVPGNPEGVEIRSESVGYGQRIEWPDGNGLVLPGGSAPSADTDALRWVTAQAIAAGLIREVTEPASPEAVLRWIKRQPHAPLGTMPPDIAAGWDAFSSEAPLITDATENDRNGVIPYETTIVGSIGPDAHDAIGRGIRTALAKGWQIIGVTDLPSGGIVLHVDPASVP